MAAHETGKAMALSSAADRIFVAELRSMAGGAIVRALARSGYDQLLLSSRYQLDLLDPQAVQAWFAAERPMKYFSVARSM